MQIISNTSNIKPMVKPEGVGQGVFVMVMCKREISDLEKTMGANNLQNPTRFKQSYGSFGNHSSGFRVQSEASNE